MNEIHDTIGQFVFVITVSYLYPKMESSQQRIAAVSREKRENEGKVIKLSQELEKKVRIY